MMSFTRVAMLSAALVTAEAFGRSLDHADYGVLLLQTRHTKRGRHPHRPQIWLSTTIGSRFVYKKFVESVRAEWKEMFVLGVLACVLPGVSTSNWSRAGNTVSHDFVFNGTADAVSTPDRGKQVGNHPRITSRVIR